MIAQKVAPIAYNLIFVVVRRTKRITIICSVELSIVAFGNRLRDCGMLQQVMDSTQMSHTIFEVQRTSAAIAVSMLQTKMNLVKYHSHATRRWKSSVIIAVCLREYRRVAVERVKSA